MAQLKTPSAPVIKSVQRLLAQINSEAEAATLAALSAKDGIVTLQPMEIAARTWGDSDYINSEDKRGAGSALWRDREKNPWHWHGIEWLIDGRGREWRRSLEAHVIDDFGNLVPVPALGGAA